MNPSEFFLLGGCVALLMYGARRIGQALALRHAARLERLVVPTGIAAALGYAAAALYPTTATVWDASSVALVGYIALATAAFVVARQARKASGGARQPIGRVLEVAAALCALVLLTTPLLPWSAADDLFAVAGSGHAESLWELSPGIAGALTMAATTVLTFVIGSTLWRPLSPRIGGLILTFVGAIGSILVYSAIFEGPNIRPGLSLGSDLYTTGWIALSATLGIAAAGAVRLSDSAR